MENQCNQTVAKEKVEFMQGSEQHILAINSLSFEYLAAGIVRIPRKHNPMTSNWLDQ